ncbi:MAG: DUF1800 family protein [Puniceicoccaceae bacterium]|nr:MAG: DUF1800 family protein [Puniceicoccaceae bacterium]
MPASPPPLPPPRTAWEPLPPEAWTAATARHLLHRTGYAAPPSQIERAVREGLATTVARLFRPSPTPERPDSFGRLDDLRAEVLAAARAHGMSPEARRDLQRELRQARNTAHQDFSLSWLRHAADPKHSAYEKFILFLANILVVGLDGVRDPILLHRHHQILREGGLGPYPDLCKAVSRSPAMLEYLDLQRSRRENPNENFARELFELFILGEGRYSEEEVREAARAFTGYRRRGEDFFFARGQHDSGSKTLFGHTGSFDGDQVIDLAFQQPAARLLLPSRLIREFLSEDPLPAPYLEELGNHWAAQDFRIEALLHRFFSSRIFHHPGHRGALIKSPIHFYLGLIQDLHLQVAPFPRGSLPFLRQMGQPFFEPPNVRGWVGGRLWINASTLAARRSLVDFLFREDPEAVLNADEAAALDAARRQGPVLLTVGPQRFATFAELPGEMIATRLATRLLPLDPPAGFAAAAAAFLDQAPAGPERNRRLALLARRILLSPHYQLC